MSQYADKDFVEIFIPSPEVKELIYKNNRLFNDREKAAIIWNSNYWLKEKHKGLEELKSQSGDEELIRQINERISYDNEALKLFEDNNQGYIYILRTFEDGYHSKGQIVGYYGTFKTAWKEGVDEGCGMYPFEIKKCQLLYDEDENRILGRIVWPVPDRDEEYYIEEMNFFEWSAGKMVLDERGQIYIFESNEMPLERFEAVSEATKTRFEYMNVDIPNPFNKFDNVRFIGSHLEKTEHVAVVTSVNNAGVDVLEWGNFRGGCSEERFSPCMLTRNTEEYCNCFDRYTRVIVGHDYGAAVWMQPVIIDDVEKIRTENVHEIGMRISVDLYFFKFVLEDVFLKFFKPDLEVNKKRFTKAFKDDGEFLTSFQSDCLEPNFYTYESISSIIKLYRDDVAGYAFDALDKLFYLLTKMMELSPEAEYISVMS